MRRCVVVCAGERGAFDFKSGENDFVICCDNGLAAARELGLAPDLLIGDFDSLRGPLPDDVATLRFPVMKNDTDSMLAIKEGLNRGYRSFSLLSALGGRLDHTVANLQALAYLLDAGADGELVGPNDAVRMVRNGKILMKRRDGFTLSVFAYGGEARGVTLTGVTYPLEKATLSTAFPLGLGNYIEAEEAGIEVGEGTLLIIASRLEEGWENSHGKSAT